PAGRIERNLEPGAGPAEVEVHDVVRRGQVLQLAEAVQVRAVIVEVDRVAGQGVEDHGLAAHVAFLPSPGDEPAPLADVLAGVDGLAVAPEGTTVRRGIP